MKRAILKGILEGSIFLALRAIHLSFVVETGEFVKSLAKLFLFAATKLTANVEKLSNLLGVMHKIVGEMAPETFGAAFIAGIIISTVFFATKKIKAKKAEKEALAKLQERVLQREKSQIQLG